MTNLREAARQRKQELKTQLETLKNEFSNAKDGIQANPEVVQALEKLDERVSILEDEL